MRLSSVLTSVLCELGIGTALFVCLQTTGEIRKSFFNFQSLLVGASLLLAWMTPAGQRDGLIPLPLAAISGLTAAVCFSKERRSGGKLFLLMAAMLAGFFLVPHAIQNQFTFKWPPVAAPVNMAAGAFLFGWASGAMILGHWYLIMRGLSFQHLQRATRQLLVAVGMRTAFFVGAWLWLQPIGAAAEIRRLSDPLLISMRIMWGLLLPGIFGFMAWRCARMGSNQAATGLLYLVVVAVLIGTRLNALAPRSLSDAHLHGVPKPPLTVSQSPAKEAPRLPGRNSSHPRPHPQ